MGNRALRKEAAELIKSWGLQTKLYRGKASKKHLDGWYLKQIILYLSFKPGDVVNDCDGNNHVIVDFADRDVYSDKQFQKLTKYYHQKDVKGYFVANLEQLQFEDGRRSCGCGPADKALSREEIEARWLRITDADIETQKQNGWWDDHSQKIYDHLKAGNHVHDQRGVLLPEFVRKFE